jgi:hypothetical protein
MAPRLRWKEENEWSPRLGWIVMLSDQASSAETKTAT